MTDPTPTPLPPASGDAKRPLSEVMALVLALVWVVAVVVQLVTAPQEVMTGPLSVLMIALIVFLPLALIWGTVTTARTIRALHQADPRNEPVCVADRSRGDRCHAFARWRRHHMASRWCRQSSTGS
jgi:hypothetical protein